MSDDMKKPPIETELYKGLFRSDGIILSYLDSDRKFSKLILW